VQIDFRGSPAPTLGVEIEAIVVDRQTRALANRATELIARLPGTDAAGHHDHVKHELFECTLEIITGICPTVGDARADLARSLREIMAVLEPEGLALCCAGTHPFTHWRDLQISPDERYHALVERLQWSARRLSIYGIHYHVGVPSAADAIAITNSLTTYLPYFLVLSASSPFWHGYDTGMASCRTKIFESLPTAGLPPHLDDWADFERFMGTLVHAGAIRTIREVWWDVRPHPDFGTVELRICDGMPTLSEVMGGAALAQSLVAWMIDELAAGRSLPVLREWTVRQNKWLAARHGVDADIIVDDDGHRRPIVDALDELVAHLMPQAERLGCAAELAAVPVRLASGPSYRRQQTAHATSGSLSAVVDLLVAELAADLAADPAAGAA
jgi:carboxylate-amine ligase